MAASLNNYLTKRLVFAYLFSQYYAIWSNIINNNDINRPPPYWSRHKISVSAKGGPIQLTLRVRIPLMARCTTLCDKVCQWLTTGWWFSPGTLVSSNNKTDHDINDWNIIKSGVKHHIANQPIHLTSNVITYPIYKENNHDNSQ